MLLAFGGLPFRAGFDAADAVFGALGAFWVLRGALGLRARGAPADAGPPHEAGDEAA